jgi:hypothetical protein
VAEHSNKESCTYKEMNSLTFNIILLCLLWGYTFGVTGEPSSLSYVGEAQVKHDNTFKAFPMERQNSVKRGKGVCKTW